MTADLLTETRELLIKDSRRLSILARQTGLNYFWLRNLKIGKVKNPGVTRVETLHRFFNAR